MIPKGFKHSKKSKRKMSKGRKGMKFTDEHKKNLRESIKELVLSGHITVTNTKKGFVYSINDKGTELCISMKTNYSIAYKENATLVRKIFGNANIKKIKSYAREMEEKSNG